MKKRILIFLMTALISAGLCGCGFTDVTDTASSVADTDTDEKYAQQDESATKDDGKTDNPEVVEEDSEEENDIESKDDNINLLDSMQKNQKREVNIFLSNFSEANYGAGYLSEAEDKINFAYIHNIINNNYFKKIYDGNNYGISADVVDATLERFFGESVPHATPTGSEMWTYNNGNFVMPAADGESCAYFSVATNMTENSNGTYNVDFNVYFNINEPHGSIDSSWYDFEAGEADQYFEFCYSGNAVLKAKVYNGSETYEIVSYETY